MSAQRNKKSLISEIRGRGGDMPVSAYELWTMPDLWLELRRLRDMPSKSCDQSNTEVSR